MINFSKPDRSMKTTDTISFAVISVGGKEFRVGYGFNCYNEKTYELWVMYKKDKDCREEYLFCEIIEEEQVAAEKAHKAAEALTEAANVLGKLFPGE